jgi:nucleoside-diphosphate-sugar epimerase
MKIAVTGGAGGVGTYVVQELLREPGHEVTVVDRVASSVSGVRWVRAALDDFGQVMSALAGSEAVIHLAAYPIPYREVPDHVLFLNNVTGTYHVHEAARLLGIRRVAIASSSAVLGWAYGGAGLLPEYLPVDEDHPCRPEDPYGIGKLCEEQIARGYQLRCGLETIALRLSWVLFPPMADGLRTRGGRPPTRVDVYSYVDPRDVATAFRAAVEVPHLTSPVVYIGADDTTCPEPLAEVLPRLAPSLAQMARELTGTRPAQSNRRAREVLGWQPRHSWRRPD